MTKRPLAVFNAGPFRADKTDGLYHYVGGDNPTLFAKMMELDHDHVVEVPIQDADCRFPDPSEIAGVVISGSPAMITDRHAWAERAAQWVADANGKVPVLGVWLACVVVTGYDGMQHRVVLARFDSTTGQIALDTRFREPGRTEPGFFLDDKTWPHGGRAKGIAHGAVFSRP